MMPAASNHLTSGQFGPPFAYEHGYLPLPSEPARQCSLYLNLIQAYLEAPGQVRSVPYSGSQGVVAPEAIPLVDIRTIDFKRIKAGMQELAREQGLDFNAIADSASRNFQRARIDLAAHRLTASNIDDLINDDNQAIDE